MNAIEILGAVTGSGAVVVGAAVALAKVVEGTKQRLIAAETKAALELKAVAAVTGVKQDAAADVTSRIEQGARDGITRVEQSLRDHREDDRRAFDKLETMMTNGFKELAAAARESRHEQKSLLMSVKLDVATLDGRVEELSRSMTPQSGMPAVRPKGS